MTVKQITIENLGKTARLHITLDEKIQYIETPHVDEMTAVLARLLNSAPPSFDTASPMQGDVRATATVLVADKPYTVKTDLDETTLSAFDTAGNDKTSDYRSRLTHCPEEEMLTVFTGRDPSIKEKLQRYKDEKIFYPQKALSKLTDGYSDTDTFRRCLCRYIGNLPQKGFDDGDLKITATANGHFDASRESLRSAPDGSTRFRLFCHLKALEFWDGFEEIRDLHSVRKPLIIQDRGNRFESPAKMCDLLEQAADSGRQVIVVRQSK